MMWRSEVRKCACGAGFNPKREAQTYCSPRCRDASKKRCKRSGDREFTLTWVPRSGDIALSDAPSHLNKGSTVIWASSDEHGGPTPGALQGDDYQLEYYEDGYPKLPACLDRRRAPLELAA